MMDGTVCTALVERRARASDDQGLIAMYASVTAWYAEVRTKGLAAIDLIHRFERDMHAQSGPAAAVACECMEADAQRVHDALMVAWGAVRLLRHVMWERDLSVEAGGAPGAPTGL